MPTFEEILALAEKRAATEVETWIPENPGDHVAGKVVELGSITTQYGEYYTTTIETLDGKNYRIAWMGAVLQAQYLRMRPMPGDIVAVHYQKDVTPKSGMQDYALIVAVVMDSTTGKAKVPIDLNIVVPTEEQIINADPRTGEIPRTTPSFEPFPDEDDEELSNRVREASKSAKSGK